MTTRCYCTGSEPPYRHGDDWITDGHSRECREQRALDASRSTEDLLEDLVLYEEFVKHVAALREHQKDYFKTRGTAQLKTAKSSERQIDRYLEGFDTQGRLIKQQKKLFG